MVRKWALLSAISQRSASRSPVARRPPCRPVITPAAIPTEPSATIAASGGRGLEPSVSIRAPAIDGKSAPGKRLGSGSAGDTTQPAAAWIKLFTV